jgi:uncharacterized membrane protein (DUF485 family)
MYPEAKSAAQWLRHGWHVAVAYIVAYLAMVMFVGWHPEPLNKNAVAAPVTHGQTFVEPAHGANP